MAGSVSNLQPLANTTIFFNGRFDLTQAQLQSLATKLGAETTKKVSDATHMICTEKQFLSKNANVIAALEKSVPILKIDWLMQAAQNESMPSGTEDKYSWVDIDDDDIAPDTSAADDLTSIDGAQSAGIAVKRKPSKSDVAGAKKAKKPKADTAAKLQKIHVPVDEVCYLQDYQVHVDSDGIIWDAALNQTNAGDNNNKFYLLQVLSDGAGKYLTWSRWGRVGVTGQHKVLGTGSLSSAVKAFESKFKDKSGLRWSDRMSDPLAGKYAFVERNYQPEDANETVHEPRDRKEADEIACTLPPQVQEVLGIMFNMQFFNAAMQAMNYDANKMPLGRLGRNSILRGFRALKDLSELIEDPLLAANSHQSPAAAIESLSNLYYSLIPHAFGFQRPPVLSTLHMIKGEVDLLESLADMKEAASIMKAELASKESIHSFDLQFRGLGLKEMTPLDQASEEFRILSILLRNSRGDTHNFGPKVQNIFRIERNGEHDRFEKSIYSGAARDRRLLWHGSRATNFGGILSQGLRIAPPEAPGNGYMFGKGVYLADLSSKSANYCYASLSANTGLLLLCEAELGNPMQELRQANYAAGEEAKAKGMWSTWGQGSFGPTTWTDAACVHPSLAGVRMPDIHVQPERTETGTSNLLYNEYICYDVAQIRLRYLFQVKM